jgi:transcriptional regulator with XRE-family HTH domain
MARVEARPVPGLLVWARERAGYTVEQSAQRLRVSPERLTAWEIGAARPTVKQLRRLGGIYGRPLAVFYLPEPPRGPRQPLRDHRRIWGTKPEEISPTLRKELDIAEDRRELVDGGCRGVGTDEEGFAVDFADDAAVDLDDGVRSDHLQVEQMPAGRDCCDHLT